MGHVRDRFEQFIKLFVNQLQVGFKLAELIFDLATNRDLLLAGALVLKLIGLFVATATQFIDLDDAGFALTIDL